MKEIWKPIKGYEGLYEVSNLGYIAGKKNILKAQKNSSGLNYLILKKNKVRKGFMVHNIVAEAFLTRDKFVTNVIHINGDKNDNSAANLKYINKYEVIACKNCGVEYTINLLMTMRARSGLCSKCVTKNWIVENTQARKDIANRHTRKIAPKRNKLRKSRVLASDDVIMKEYLSKKGFTKKDIELNPELLEINRLIIQTKRLCKT